MRMKFLRTIIFGLMLALVVASALTVVACPAASPTPTPTPTASPTPAGSATPTIIPAKVLISIQIVPESPPILGLGDLQQFIAIGTYSDGSTQDISSQVSWGSSDVDVATIDSSGLVTAVNIGDTIIVACVSGVCRAVSLTVRGG